MSKEILIKTVISGHSAIAIRIGDQVAVSSWGDLVPGKPGDRMVGTVIEMHMSHSPNGFLLIEQGHTRKFVIPPQKNRFQLIVEED